MHISQKCSCKNSRRFVVGLICTLGMTVLFNSCCTRQDSLDKIKAYHPDDNYFKSSLVSLHFFTEVSPIPKVDSAFKELLKRYELPVTAENAKDGKYVGESPYDAFDYKHIAEIEIKNGNIIDIDYNEIYKGGIGKQEDTAYCNHMSISGTTPAIAYPLMEAQLLNAQNMMEVDAVTGATYSLYRFRFAVLVALMVAELQ